MRLVGTKREDVSDECPIVYAALRLRFRLLAFYTAEPTGESLSLILQRGQGRLVLLLASARHPYIHGSNSRKRARRARRHPRHA